jgi:hypothetical protein
MGKLKAPGVGGRASLRETINSPIAILTRLDAFSFAFEFVREKPELLKLSIATISTHFAIFSRRLPQLLDVLLCHQPTLGRKIT